jgi:hypothetical protein
LKIQIVIPIWKRPEVTKFCFEHLREMIVSTKHDFNVLCVISEPEYIEICESFGFDWVACDNNPLGNKINHGIKHALAHFEFDYLMMMNSDSIIKPELFDFYEPLFKNQHPFFGVNKVTFVNFKTKEAKDFVYEFSIIGPGKCIHYDVVSKLRGNLYRAELNRCLDDTMMEVLTHNKVGGKIVEYSGQLVYDVKSEVNIHPWEKFEAKGKKVELEWQQQH